MFTFIASSVQTLLFFTMVVILAAFGAGLWFLLMLRRGMRGGQRQSKKQHTQQRPQQPQEPKADPAQYEQPLFDEKNAEYVDFEEVK